MRNLMKILQLFFISFCLSSLLLAKTYQVNNENSKVQFQIGLARVLPVVGEFHQFSGKANFDPQTQILSQASAKIEVQSIDTQNKRRDRHLNDTDFFEVETYPYITFVSERVERASNGHYTVYGQMTIKNTTHPVVLKGSLVKITAVDGKPALVFSATGKINRQDFNVNYNQKNKFGEWLLADEVKLMLDLVLVQQ